MRPSHRRKADLTPLSTAWSPAAPNANPRAATSASSTDKKPFLNITEGGPHAAHTWGDPMSLDSPKTRGENLQSSAPPPCLLYTDYDSTPAHPQRVTHATSLHHSGTPSDRTQNSPKNHEPERAHSTNIAIGQKARYPTVCSFPNRVCLAWTEYLLEQQQNIRGRPPRTGPTFGPPPPSTGLGMAQP